MFLAFARVIVGLALTRTGEKLTAKVGLGSTWGVDTREKILETATRLFSAQGYGSTSLSQVAKEARVSKALIFWHFESKEKLFSAALRRTLEPYIINAGDLDRLPEIDQIRRLIDDYYAFTSENVYSVKFFLSLILREEKHPDDLVGHMNELQRVYRDMLADIIESGRQKGVFRSTVVPALDAGLIMTALHGILVQGFMGKDAPERSEVLLQYLKSTLVDGLRQETVGGTRTTPVRVLTKSG